jgi:protein-S-isoprenylcysteine O-methyltransferase Ste14
MVEPHCSECRFRVKFDKNPKSILGRIWRWHATWCPGWKAYIQSLSAENRAETATRISTTLAGVILSLYLVVGTILEERKLVAEFGESYRAYQREVSMLVPWKWLSTAFIKMYH